MTDLATQAAERAQEVLEVYEELPLGGRGYRHAGDMWRDMKPMAEDVLALVAALQEARAEIADLAPREADLWDENTGLKAALQTAKERLWQIDLVARSEYDTDEQAFAAVKKMAFDLRISLAALSGTGTEKP